jgi:prevent-host-death family protein
MGARSHQTLVRSHNLEALQLAWHQQGTFMIPVNEAQQQLQDLIDAVSQSHQPIVIAGQSNNAVLLSESDWASIQETLYLLSVPGMRESIREGLATPIEACDRELEW